jgi:GGDEF domain-containing protein
MREHRFLTGEHLSLKVSGSFGLATYPEDGDTVHAILRSADSMMYEVKNTTRDDIAIMGVPRMRQRAALISEMTGTGRER